MVVAAMPLLDSITDPRDVAALPAGRLDDLASEIRRFLVERVSATGGHLGSNLGAVELTIALHRVFRSPEDAILWDTGHQAYVHKILTGRREGFTRLRQAGGLSGYPSRAESPHDLVENSHASAILSYASGLAAADRLAGSRRHVVAVVGDGALTGGMAYEALNNIGFRRAAVLVVVNDNGRSYAPTISNLWQGRSPAPFFESLGLSFFGTVDGHDFAAIEAALRYGAAEVAGDDGPVVVHVRTRKGCGYPPAETDPEKCMHDVGVFDPATGRSRASSGATYTQAFTEAIVAAGASRPDVVAITAAMPGSTGLIPFSERFPDRFFDVGIAEQHAVTAAAGMAMGGLRPVVAVYSTFLNRAWDQICHDVGLHGLPVVFCIDRAGITGEDGPSHHGVLDLALLTTVPGMTVLAPSSYEEVGTMLSTALSIDGSVAIRWPKGPARRAGCAGVGAGLRGRRTRTGADVCLVAVGRLLAAAEEAATLLEPRGIAATVWDARVVQPLDPALVSDAAQHPLVVTVEDGTPRGAGAVMSAALRARSAGAGPQPRLIMLGTPAAYLPHGRPADILAGLGLDGAGIARQVCTALTETDGPRPVPALTLGSQRRVGGARHDAGSRVRFGNTRVGGHPRFRGAP